MKNSDQRTLTYDEYERRYDTYTVERVLDYKKTWASTRSDGEIEEILSNLTIDVMLYFVKGGEWKAKRSTIERWMEEDRKRDELYESAQPLTDICCSTCGCEMIVESKTLTDREGEDDGLFFYHCSSQHHGRAFYASGSEHVSKPVLCEECGADDVRMESDSKNNVLTFTDTCGTCEYVGVYTIDKTPKFTEAEFESLRAEYCLSDEEGQKYLEGLASMAEWKKILGDIQDKEDNRAKYVLIDSIERLTVPQVKKRIQKLLEAAAFTNIHFDEPVMKIDVQLTAYADDATTANTHDRKNSVSKLIKKELVTTDWKLMNDGISSRMGIFTFKLCGFDREEDIRKLVEARLKNEELELPESPALHDDLAEGKYIAQDGTIITL